MYGYVLNDPINLIDVTGFSAADVTRIRTTFNNTVNSMNQSGQRTSPGWWNNMNRSAYDWSGGRMGSQFLGCGEQADRVQKDLRNNSYDDKWNFEWEGLMDPLPHQRIRGTSDNPTDPVLIIDPHRSQFQTGGG